MKKHAFSKKVEQKLYFSTNKIKKLSL